MDNTTTPPTENPDNVTPDTEPVAPGPEPTAPVEETTTAPEAPAPQPVVAEHGSKKGAVKTLLVALLALVLAALAAGAVYMWQQNKVDDLNAQLTSAQSAKTTPSSNATATTTSADPDQAKATTLVKDFYAAYNKEGAVDSQALIKKYGTDNLAFYYKYYNYGFDPIVCAQDTITYTASGSKTKDGVATVLLKRESGDTITVRVVDQGGLKVDGVTCPGETGNMEPHPSDN